MALSQITYRIRISRLDDVAAVDRLFARSYPALLKHDYAPSVMVTAVPIISKAQPKLLASGSFYVAEGPDGEILGAGGWTARNPNTGEARPNEANIRHFATDPAALRQGIAGAIMARVFQDARAAGHDRMACLSTFTAVPFYRAKGFSVQGPVTVTLRQGVEFPAIGMTRSL